MTCPSCQHENRPSARFCEECGTRLPHACPQCGVAVRPAAKFCDACGVSLETSAAPTAPPGTPTAPAGSAVEADAPPGQTAGLTLEEQFTILQQALPPSLRDNLVAPAEGQNRIVTVLFADMSSSVRATADLHPEDAADFVNRLLKAMVDVLLRYQGRVDRFLGDGVLAVFGVPHAHESDPERAIQAALEIRETARELALEITAGINTGEVYVGGVGSERHQEVTVMGPAVNLASRLQGAAEPGQILVGEATHRQTRRAFEFTPLSLHVKGIDHAVAAYAVTRPLPHPEKARGIEGLRAELIGRDAELGKLQEALAEVQQGRGQIVSLIGEAGVGKSRLVAELKQAVFTAEPAEPAERGRRGDEGTGDATQDRSGASPPHLLTSSPLHSLSASSAGSAVKSPPGRTTQVLWLEGRCLELGMSASYWVFVDLLREYVAWRPEEEDRMKGERVAAALRQCVERCELSEERAGEIAPLFGSLLSVRFGNEWDDRLRNASPEQIKHQTFLAVRDFLVALASSRPVVVVFEDLHWADSLSIDLILLLMEALTLAPLLLLCVYRPEPDHRSWLLGTVAGQKCPQRYTEITLRELTPAQSRRLVDALLAIDNLPERAKDLILEKARGNPFFVEEVLRSLIDTGMLSWEGDRWCAKEGIENTHVPETVQSVILSRVDRLESDLKRVLEGAAVIGRLFRRRILEHTLQGQAELERALWQLEDRQFIFEEHTLPEEEYSFNHVLTQETIYESILRRRRGAFHQRVAEVIETLYRDGLDEFYEPLAYHYERSGNAEKALEYLRRAGEKAARRYANQEALRHFEQALKLAEGRACYEDVLAQRASLWLSLYRGREAAGDYEQLLARAQQRGDRAQELAALIGLAAALYVIALDDPHSDAPARCPEIYESALRLAETLNDRASMARILIAATTLLDFYPEQRPQAAANADRALALSRETGDEALILSSRLTRLRFLDDDETEREAAELLPQLETRNDLVPLKDLHYRLMWIYLSGGRFERAIASSEIGARLSLQVGVLPVVFPTARAFALLHLGRYRDAFASLQQEVADDEHRLGAALQGLGRAMLFLELRAYGRASEAARRVIEEAKALRRPWIQELAQITLARSLVRAGQLDAEQRTAITGDLERIGMPLPAEVCAEIHLAEGRLEEALREAERAPAQAEENRWRPGIVSGLVLKQRILLELNRPAETLAAADAALPLAEEMGALPMLWRIRAVRAVALRHLGDEEAAAREQEAAGAVVQKLRAEIEEADLEQSFLSDPLIASLLTEGSADLLVGVAGRPGTREAGGDASPDARGRKE